MATTRAELEQKSISGSIGLVELRHLMLYMFIFLLGYENWNALQLAGGITIPRLAGLFYGSLALSNCKMLFSINNLNKHFIIILLLLWGWLVSVSIFSVFIYGYDAQVYFTFFQVIVLFLIITNEVRLYPEVRNRIFLSFVMGVMSIHVLLLMGIGIETGNDGQVVGSVDEATRVWFMGLNPNLMGTLAAMSLLLIISLVFSGIIRTKLRYGLLFLLPSCLLLIGQSGSAGAYLLIFLGVAAFFILIKARIKRKLALFVIGGALSVYMVFFLSGFEYLSDKILRFFETGDTTHRTALWGYALQIATDHPFIGIGKPGARYVMSITSHMNKTAHNVFLDLLMWGGPIALGLYLYFFWSLAKRGWTRLKATGDPTSIVILLCLGLFMVKAGGGFGAKFAWVLFACIVPTGYSAAGTTKTFKIRERPFLPDDCSLNARGRK